LLLVTYRNNFKKIKLTSELDNNLT